MDRTTYAMCNYEWFVIYLSDCGYFCVFLNKPATEPRFVQQSPTDMKILLSPITILGGGGGDYR